MSQNKKALRKTKTYSSHPSIAKQHQYVHLPSACATNNKGWGKSTSQSLSILIRKSDVSRDANFRDILGDKFLGNQSNGSFLQRTRDITFLEQISVKLIT